MKNSSYLFVIVLQGISTLGFSKNIVEENKQMLPIFERLTNDLKNYRVDTSAVPNDKITKEIMELRALKGVFNINEAIEFKLEEDRKKQEIPGADFDKFSAYFKMGDGKRWLDNAIINIYRQYFSYKELKQLVRFYKSPAGQKMATEFPFMIMKSLAAGEAIKNMY